MTYDDIIDSVKAIENAKKRRDSAIGRQNRKLAAILKMFKGIVMRAGEEDYDCGTVDCGPIRITFCVLSVNFDNGTDSMTIDNQYGDYRISFRGHESFIAETIDKAPEYARMFAEAIKKDMEQQADQEESKAEVGLWT